MASGAVGDIRVLSVIHAPTYAGAHNQLLRLHGPLRERGVELIAALPPDAADAAERLRAAGVEVHTIALPRLRATARPDVQARFLIGLPGAVRGIGELVTGSRA